MALKNEFEKQGFTGATKIFPHKEDIISVSFNVEKKDIPEFTETCKKFMKENDIEVETKAKGDSITVQLPVVNLEGFVDFLGDKGFKLDSEEEEQIEAILEKDDAKTTKKYSDKEDAIDDRRSNATARSERKEDD